MPALCSARILHASLSPEHVVCMRPAAPARALGAEGRQPWRGAVVDLTRAVQWGAEGTELVAPALPEAWCVPRQRGVELWL